MTRMHDLYKMLAWTVGLEHPRTVSVWEFPTEPSAGGTMMTFTHRLDVKVAAAVLLTFSASCFLSSPAAQAQTKKPEYKDKADAASVHSKITPAAMGGGVVILVKPDGAIEAYAINPPGGPGGITVYTKDENGDDMWYDEGGKQVDPPTPPLSGPDLKGAGNITDIRVFDFSSTCTMMNLNGQWICVVLP
jgi:hypothetical protein